MLKKYLKIFIILAILMLFYLYIANITLMPKSITLLQGESLQLAKLWGISFKQKSTTNPNLKADETGSIIETSSNIGENKTLELRKNKHGNKLI